MAEKTIEFIDTYVVLRGSLRDHGNRTGGPCSVIYHSSVIDPEYAAALDRFLGAEEGSSDYEATLSALLEREKELLAGVVGQEEQELTPDERRRVQACLAEREFDPGVADGIFGPRTRTAIRAWQASQGREESGRLDQSSARKLLEECEVAVAEADTETTTESVERTFEPKCAAIFDGQPEGAKDELLDKTEMCFLEFVDKHGCHLVLNNEGIAATIYDHRPMEFGASAFSIGHIENWIVSRSSPMEIIGLRWSGGCSGGVPDGQGTLSALMPRGVANAADRFGAEASEITSWNQEWTGRFVGGVPHGNWTSIYRVAGRGAELYTGPDYVMKGVRWSSGTEYPFSFENQHEYNFVMMNGDLHGEYIHVFKNFGSDHGGNWSQCHKDSGKFVNGKYHSGGNRPC